MLDCVCDSIEINALNVSICGNYVISKILPMQNSGL
jgi:hypothetical protein